MRRVSTKFGVDSSSRFRFRMRTHSDSYRRHWYPHIQVWSILWSPHQNRQRIPLRLKPLNCYHASHAQHRRGRAIATRGLCVEHSCVPCKNGWTDWVAARTADSNPNPTPSSRNHVQYRLRNYGEYDWTVRGRRRCCLSLPSLFLFFRNEAVTVLSSSQGGEQASEWRDAVARCAPCNLS